jgi:hypothetical protein
MEIETPKPRFYDGPFVQVACFCDMTLEGKDNTLSIIRIIDTVTHGVRAPEPPTDMEPFEHELKLVVGLKSGFATGRHTLTILPQLPSGETGKSHEQSIHLGGDEAGHTMVMNMKFTFKYEGVHIFWVLLDGERLTGVPLRVRYETLRTGIS